MDFLKLQTKTAVVSHGGLHLALDHKLLVSAGDLSGDLGSEVVDLLLNALTLGVVDGVDEGDLAAQLLACVGNATRC